MHHCFRAKTSKGRKCLSLRLWKAKSTFLFFPQPVARKLLRCPGREPCAPASGDSIVEQLRELFSQPVLGSNSRPATLGLNPQFVHL